MTNDMALGWTPDLNGERAGNLPTTRGNLSGGRTAAEDTVGRRDLWVVVLAGGEGTRLRSFARQVLGSERPKQFCQILGSGSMLRHTWGRAARLVPPERIVTIITAGQERYIEEEARHGVPGIVRGQPLATGAPTDLYTVSRFWEKPDRRTAARLFARGHFWHRFNLRPSWLPAYLQTQAQAAPAS